MPLCSLLSLNLEDIVCEFGRLDIKKSLYLFLLSFLFSCHISQVPLGKIMITRSAVMDSPHIIIFFTAIFSSRIQRGLYFRQKSRFTRSSFLILLIGPSSHDTLKCVKIATIIQFFFNFFKFNI